MPVRDRLPLEGDPQAVDCRIAGRRPPGDGQTCAGTNTIEGFFSIFKRGMKGVYQHCGKQHLHRYLAEFDFRYNQRVRLGVDDSERSKRALNGIVGKRLTYKASASVEVR